MPELAKPCLSPGTSLKEHRNSKSPGVPLVQIRNVLPLAGFSAVVWPVMAPSLTDHNSGLPSHLGATSGFFRGLLSLTDHSFGLPSQPVRSLPLKIPMKPCSAAGTRTGLGTNQPAHV